MESKFSRIVSTLLDSRILLKNIIHFAELLRASASEIIKLQREIDNNTVDYRNAIQQLIEGWTAREGRRTVGDLVNVLKVLKILDLAEYLEENFPLTTIISNCSSSTSSGGRKQNKIWNVSEPVPSFVGREEEILRLDSFLQSDRERVLVISGMGGQGKTQVCRKWIQLLKQDSECPRIIWLAGESSQILMSTILSFLKAEVAYLNESALKSFQEVLDKFPMILEEKKKVLWVIDNVDTDYEEIKTFSRFLLLNMKNSKIVITSRLRTILPKSAVYLTLETLSLEAAEKLIRQSLDGELKEEDVKELCSETGFHALALQLSIGFIKCKHISSARGKGFGISAFLTSFRENKKPILEDTEDSSCYNKSVLHHVEITTQDLNEKGMKLPQEIMKIISLFRFDGIEFSFLFEVILNTVEGYEEQVDGQPNQDERRKLEVEEALDALHSLSLIQAELPIIQIHPLIQETTRILYPDWKVFASSILKHVDIENLSKPNLQHILRLWEIVSRDDSLLRENAPAVKRIYYGLLDTSQIQLLLPFTNSHRKTILRLLESSTDVEVIRAEFLYGQALRRTGKFNESLAHLNFLQANAIRHLGQKDEITFEIESAKADALYELDRHEEGEKLYKALLPRCTKVYGEVHSQTMTIKNNLALTLSGCNRLQEALELYENILQWEIRNIGDFHQDTLTTRHNIACCYAKQGDFQKASCEFTDILKLNKKNLGDKHYQTLLTRGWIARVLSMMGDYNKARADYEKLIDDSEEVLGPVHPNTLSSRMDYAACLIDLGETEKAKTELEELIALGSRTLGPDDSLLEESKNLLQKAEESRTQDAKFE